MSCPNCGSPEAEGTQPADASCSFFKCGSIVGTGIVTTSWPCRELAALRAKLTPECAEPLVWEWKDSGSVVEIIADGIGCRYTITSSRMKYQIDLWADKRPVLRGFADVDNAKAHAEELHQAAWKELVKKWGRK